MNYTYTKEAFKLKLHKMKTYYKVAAIMEIIMAIGIIGIIVGSIVLIVVSARAYSAPLDLGINLGENGDNANNEDSFDHYNKVLQFTSTNVLIVYGIFGFIASISNLVKLIMLLLATIAISEIREIAAANKKFLPFDPLIPGVLAFILIIAVYFAWSRAHKLYLIADELVKDFPDQV